MADHLTIDNSTMKATMACSTQATMRYILHLTTENEEPPLKAGSAVHEALAEYFRTGNPQAALKTFDDEYQAYWAERMANPLPVEVDDSTERLSHRNVRAILDEWLARHPMDDLPFVVESPKFVEVGFEYPLGEVYVPTDVPYWSTSDRAEEVGVNFSGRLDLLARMKSDGRLWIVDHKTTRRITSQWVRKYRMDPQIDGYLWAVEHVLKEFGVEEPVAGMLINAIELSSLPGSNRKCTKHGVQYAECSSRHANMQMFTATRTDKQKAQWWDQALTAAEKFSKLRGEVQVYGTRVDELPMEGPFTDSCMFCQYYDFCGMGRPADMADSMFIRKEWRPFELTEGGKG